MNINHLLEHPITRNVRKVISVLTWVGIYVGITYIYHRYTVWESDNRIEWANKNCPGLLSITRSARDTLNLMRAVDDCNTYVLRNLE
jgi:H+/Cl- antiporter ClcA